MTKARKLADLIDSNGDVKSTNLDNVPAVDLTNLSASNLTSGTIPDARVSASAVQQHATSFDDNKIQTNLALLGFKTASVGSLATYNLQDQSVDEFKDASGINSSASTNANVTADEISGGVPPSVTHDADTTGTDGIHTWYRWTDTSSTGSYSQNTSQTVDFLVVAGGGPGGFAESGGGGGAGGLRTSYGSTSGGGASAESQLTLGANTSYTITVGAGGAAPTAWSQHHGSQGSASSISGSDITDITTVGGGVGNGYEYSTHTLDNGGSGGGGGDPSGSMSTGGTGTANQGYNGGNSGSDTGNDSTQAGGGGGGAGGTGGTGVTGSSGYGGTGGVGLNMSITGTSVGYAGGGGGGHTGNGSTATHGGGKGGNGGGGFANGTDGTGGGGGAGYLSDGNAVGRGGNGVVILRRLTNAAVSNMTAVSNAVTAQSQPSSSDFIMLMENKTGTATINTDIKAFVSRDNGSTFTQGTLVDEGTYATNTKILAFHDLDISSQPSGTQMVYKVQTFNQSSGSKVTAVKAVSLGWK